MSRSPVCSDNEFNEEERVSDLDIMSDAESEYSEHNSDTEQSAVDSDDDTDRDDNNNYSAKKKGSSS